LKQGTGTAGLVNEEAKRPEPGGQLLYGLHDNPGVAESLVYALQWVAFALANAAIVPVVVGMSLGLDRAGTGTLVQRTFFFSAVASLLQVTAGHRYPILEGPAGMWYGVFITLAALAPELGKPLSLLRSDLEMGLLIGGLLSIFLGVTGCLGRVRHLFTPAVNGTFLVLMSLQLSSSIIPGMFGVTRGSQTVNWPSLADSLITMIIILWVSISWKGFLKSVSVLIGVAAGWAAAAFLGLAPVQEQVGVGWLAVPEIFAWGRPTWDTGIVLTSALTSVIVLSNLVASILGMANLTGQVTEAKDYNRGVIFTGVSDLLAGAGAVIGFIPYASAIGFSALSGVASRVPFIIGACLLGFLGLVSPVGNFFASIPVPVGYTVLLTTFCQVLGAGLKDYARLGLDNRDLFVIGIPLIVGTGIMFIPSPALRVVPAAFRYLLGNGLIVGMTVCFLLEHLFLPRKKP